MYGKCMSETTKKKISEVIKEKFKNKELDQSSEKHSQHKLLCNAIIRIRKLCSEGKLTQREIGEKFCVKQSTISSIKNNKRWKNI